MTGIATLSPIGTNTVLTINAVNYLANAVQTAQGLSSTQVFMGNVTLPTSVTARIEGQLGYTKTTFRGAQTGANPLQILNLAQFTNLAWVRE